MSRGCVNRDCVDRERADRECADWDCADRERACGSRVRAWEQGSGTVTGVALVCAVGVMLSVILAVGNVLMSKSRAQTAADNAALAGATALYESTGAPCAIASNVAARNGGTLTSCEVHGEDVVAAASVRSRVPVVGDVEAHAKAGPKDCE
ncbi:Rv3654c family TadE-like protein [Bifidobacterium simiarum]|uniref:Pilus assembly protein TadE n=1 Tax=Bifidobacterium simiarum TaxID=2045441 RepID=A0A2M9HG89_9BIFI|nr:Rv3654c family TadE-like protein [Bifidobacterium simiarum]PJM75809.1 pilus assembly protein TadE [Bifidobacterium simiarum]